MLNSKSIFKKPYLHIHTHTVEILETDAQTALNISPFPSGEYTKNIAVNINEAELVNSRYRFFFPHDRRKMAERGPFS